MFYANGAPAPARLPKYLVKTARGAWGFAYPEDALDMARQLRTNGTPCQAFVNN